MEEVEKKKVENAKKEAKVDLDKAEARLEKAEAAAKDLKVEKTLLKDDPGFIADTKAAEESVKKEAEGDGKKEFKKKDKKAEAAPEGGPATELAPAKPAAPEGGPATELAPAAAAFISIGEALEKIVLKKKKDVLGEADRDPWVYQFGLDSTAAADGLRRSDTGVPFGWHPANIAPAPPAWGSYGANSAEFPKPEFTPEEPHASKAAQA